MQQTGQRDYVINVQTYWNSLMTLIMSIRIATGLRARQSGIWFLEGATDFPHFWEAQTKMGLTHPAIEAVQGYRCQCMMLTFHLHLAIRLWAGIAQSV